MTDLSPSRKIGCLLLIAACLAAAPSLIAQDRESDEPPALRTPLTREVLDLLAGEISGQVIFNNEVRLAGAPWQREPGEFTGTFHETRTILEIAAGTGFNTIRLERWPSDRKISYPEKGEFRLVSPETRLIARLEADPAMIASGSRDTDLTARLVYIPPLDEPTLRAWAAGEAPEDYRGAVALMWSHADRNTAAALDAAEVHGVVSFSSRERYLDPDQVVYSRGSYTDGEHLRFGLTLSWRQWSELMEDLEAGKDITARCRVSQAEYPDRFENIYAWIPGTESGEKGVLFTAHLFEGYTKRGANDNMSGCAVQLEIWRALSRLIERGALPQPRRTIGFLWPNEISGTYARISGTPGFSDELSININMDMVGEGLRKNNAIFTMSECPSYAPSYLDALAESMMNYVWRTNDIVYLPDSPRGRRGGQYFPRPLWEKNGSRDAFRYFVHAATGGSDHICFNNPSVGVPGIEFFTWPDQWYHADTDTPDKSDPTQMKRVAFIGAATAWAAADCNDEVLLELADRVTSFGTARIGKREQPAALRMVGGAGKDQLEDAVQQAFRLIDLAVSRETGAVASLQEIASGSKTAESLIGRHSRLWELYRKGFENQVLGLAALRAQELGAPAPERPAAHPPSNEAASKVPSLSEEIRGRQFYVDRCDAFKSYIEANPDALKKTGLDRGQQRAVQNWIDGRRSVAVIHDRVLAETGKPLALSALLEYLDLLRAVGWIGD